MKKLLSVVLSAALLFTTGVHSVGAFGLNASIEHKDLADHLEKAKLKTVRIFTQPYENWPTEPSFLAGTGWFMKNNYIVTAWHCIDGSPDPNNVAIEMYREDGKLMRVDGLTLVYKDTLQDIAVYRIKDISDRVAKELKNIGYFDIAKNLKQGEFTLAMGYPEVNKGAFTHTEGDVMALDWPTIWTYGGTTVGTTRLEMKVAHGQSGGPIINSKGEVVGMVRGFDNQDANIAYGVSLDGLKKGLNDYINPKPISAVSVEIVTKDTAVKSSGQDGE
ncbi:Serine protease Do-like HtrB [compost metagenome]